MLPIAASFRGRSHARRTRNDNAQRTPYRRLDRFGDSLPRSRSMRLKSRRRDRHGRRDLLHLGEGAHRRACVYRPQCADTVRLLVASELSDDWENILMLDDHNRCGHHKRRCNDGAPLPQFKCSLTCDDAATVIGIFVSLLVMLIGALVCIVCFGLLMVLLHIGLHLLTS
jgi:hypothetical protein